MRPLHLGSPPISQEEYRRWADEAFRQIQEASYEGLETVAQDFTATNYTASRSLNAGTATLAQLANVVATLLTDMKNLGVKNT